MINKLYLFVIFCSLLFCSIDTSYSESNSEAIQDLILFPFFGYIPSLGQLHNDKPIKAVVLTSMKAYWIQEYNKSSKENNLSDRNRSLWWMVVLLIYGSIDAYIDANLKTFPYDETIEDIQENKKIKE